MTKCHDQRHLINEALTWSLWLRPSHSSTTALFVWDMRRAFLYPHQSLSSGAQCGCRKHQGWIMQILFHGSCPLYRWVFLKKHGAPQNHMISPVSLNSIVLQRGWALIWNIDSWHVAQIPRGVLPRQTSSLTAVYNPLNIIRVAENGSSERDIVPRMFLRTHDFFTKNASLFKPDVTAHTCSLSKEETGRSPAQSQPELHVINS